VNDIFITYFYQPFFNILVGIYWGLGQIIPNPDMGMAVILFTVVVRFVMLPLSLAGDRSAAEKVAIAKEIQKVKQETTDPIKRRNKVRQIMKSNPMTIFFEALTIGIQVLIILMLYRIFKTGLEGADLHLVYDFVPTVPLPINLVFLGEVDLSQPSLGLNFLQSVAIFTLESLAMFLSPKPVTRKEFLSLAIAMPVVSFLIFGLLPAGKKLFIITSLFISILILLLKQVAFWYYMWLRPTPAAVSETET
jgi:membrane protein insertase Oxa1/YidC/SpoIIIJ